MTVEIAIVLAFVVGSIILFATEKLPVDLTALAVRHRGLVMREHLEEMELRAGDVLLFEIERRRLDLLREDKTFVLVSEAEFPTFRKRRMVMAIAIIAFVVGSAALGLLPILVSAIIGCILMVLSRCLTLEEAYGAVQWKVVFLLGGVLALGKAMEKSGAALLLANTLVETVGVLEFGESGLGFELRAWSTSLVHRKGLLISALNFAIYDKFTANGIEIPFPQRDVRIRGGNVPVTTSES